MGSRQTDQAPAYAYYMDNIKLILIFLVVFNHMIAFQVIDGNVAAEYIYYGILCFICLRLFLCQAICPRGRRTR